ncbi:MAG: hypothetical protein OXB96_01290 [Candidatus Kaiserbacteria bacterium]|nr:hypothetical protein [Candidatus Kaiserbacteria bacterium]
MGRKSFSPGKRKRGRSRNGRKRRHVHVRDSVRDKRNGDRITVRSTVDA